MAFSKDDIDIDGYIEELKMLVNQNWYDIDFSRIKNKKFLEKYSFEDQDIRDVLISLKSCDFVERKKTQDYKYKSDYLYVFKKNLYLDDLESENELDSVVEVIIYIKTSIPPGDSYKTMIVVSFHEDE